MSKQAKLSTDAQMDAFSKELGGSLSGLLANVSEKILSLHEEIVDNISILSSPARVKYLDQLEAEVAKELDANLNDPERSPNDPESVGWLISLIEDEMMGYLDDDFNDYREIASKPLEHLRTGIAVDEKAKQMWLKGEALKRTVYCFYYTKLLNHIRCIRKMVTLINMEQNESSEGSITSAEASLKSASKEAAQDSLKIMTTLSVPQLAYFFRVLLGSEIIKLDKRPEMARYQTDIQEVISRAFATTDSEAPKLETDWKLERMTSKTANFWTKKFDVLETNSNLEKLKSLFKAEE